MSLRKNILSVDVEDWFHICGVTDFLPRKCWRTLESRVVRNTRRILYILKESGTRATFFVLGSVAENFPDLVAEIREAGHEIATHGHAHRRVYTMDPVGFKADLDQSIEVLSGITKERIMGFRAPEWSIRDDSLWALEILQQSGFRYDSSMAPLRIIGNPRYPITPWKHNLGRGELWEIPPLVGSLLGLHVPMGGGWGLKTFPYAFIRSTIHTLNKQGAPAMVFLHPREFDPEPPRPKLPLLKQLVLNAGVTDTEKRLQRLLSDFDFTSIADFLSN